VKNLAEKLVPDPKQIIYLDPKQLSRKGIYEFVIKCKEREKSEIIELFFKNLGAVGQTIVFCETRETSESLHKFLVSRGHKVGLLHGGMSQADRNREFDTFKTNNTRTLITTDLFQRGLDIEDAHIVINLDVPFKNNEPDADAYMHRTGRTGRYKKAGLAFTLVHDDKNWRGLAVIARRYQKRIDEIPLENLEVTLNEIRLKLNPEEKK